MTRARCAECGAVLAIEVQVGVVSAGNLTGDHEAASELLVHPCGACLQEARADAIASYNDSREPPVDAGLLTRVLDEGRD